MGDVREKIMIVAKTVFGTGLTVIMKSSILDLRSLNLLHFSKLTREKVRNGRGYPALFFVVIAGIAVTAAMN